MHAQIIWCFSLTASVFGTCILHFSLVEIHKIWENYIKYLLKCYLYNGNPYTDKTAYCIEMASWGHFYWHGLTLIPVWISSYINNKVWEELTYPYLNFNGATVEVLVWISNFTPHFTEYVITYPCWDWSLTMPVKRGPWYIFHQQNWLHLLWFKGMDNYIHTNVWYVYCNYVLNKRVSVSLINAVDIS